MAKIFYSMAGEGRGHATRVRTIVELLREHHELTLFAPAAAFDFLSKINLEKSVAVREIPGLLFHYRGQHMSYWKTLVQCLGYLRELPQLVRQLSRIIRDEQPDLVITDFEPALPRAALKCDVPFISLDHQHFLVACDHSALPANLRWQAQAMSPIVKAYYQGQVETVVSSFYFPPLKREYEQAVQAGVLLRPAIERAISTEGDHLLVYLRRDIGGGVLEALSRCGREVRIYGLGTLPPSGNLSFHQVDETGFLRDLASCHALICTCGNQLVGEALSLRKPVLALPEPGQFEQHINAHYLRAGGGGEWIMPEEIAFSDVLRFLGRVDEFRHRINPAKLNGNHAALEAIQRNLPAGQRELVLPGTLEHVKGVA